MSGATGFTVAVAAALLAGVIVAGLTVANRRLLRDQRKLKEDVSRLGGLHQQARAEVTRLEHKVRSLSEEVDGLRGCGQAKTTRLNRLRLAARRLAVRLHAAQLHGKASERNSQSLQAGHRARLLRVAGRLQKLRGRLRDCDAESQSLRDENRTIRLRLASKLQTLRAGIRQRDVELLELRDRIRQSDADKRRLGNELGLRMETAEKNLNGMISRAEERLDKLAHLVENLDGKSEVDDGQREPSQNETT